MVAKLTTNIFKQWKPFPDNTQEETNPFIIKGPKSTYEDPTDPNINRPDKKQGALIKKQNDSTIIRNVRSSTDGTLIDIKIPDNVPQGEDTKGIIIKGKNKGKEFIYIDNPPLNK